MSGERKPRSVGRTVGSASGSFAVTPKPVSSRLGGPNRSVSPAEALAQAAALHGQGRLPEAEALYRAVLAADPRSFNALHLLGVLRHQQGRHEDAVSLIRSALAIHAKAATAHVNLAHALSALGRHDEALAACRAALRIQPDHADAHNALGAALTHLQRHEEAADAYRRTTQLQPGDARAHSNLGSALRALGRLDEAIACFGRALEIDPGLAKVHVGLGRTYGAAGRPGEAVACFRRAVELAPGLAEAHTMLGATFHGEGRFADAIASYRLALEIDPSDPHALYGCGNALASLNRFEEAATAFRAYLAVRPDDFTAQTNLGNAFLQLDRADEAADCYRRALAIEPEHAALHQSLGLALTKLRRLDEAIAAYRQAAALEPDRPYLRGDLAHAERQACDWSAFADTARALTEDVRQGRDTVTPFVFLTFSGDPADQLRCARRHCETTGAAAAASAPRRAARTGQRIRIGYLSADFHHHATTHLMAELFERHDRDRFEIVAFSYAPDDGTPMRRRLETAFDRFVDIRTLGNAEAAQSIADLGIDIAVDLKGHTTNTRMEILAHRPAPVQVHYLGYPGTTGADYIDYILVDGIVAPADQQPFFSERLVHLPGCYQVNDTKRAIAPETPSRAACGLPEAGFVFCCFNHTYKITPEVFEVWMRLLWSVPGSVLWLLRSNDAAERNLRREAAARGIDPARLVMAPRAAPAEHLARHRLADLFLDTLPVNAHTTASDALWAGLPLVTCTGPTFASRVAGSLLHSVGLPDLVTTSLDDYEALARALATDPARLAEMRARLARNREAAPLFDTDRFRRGLERAYVEMMERWRAGQPPQAFAVSADG